METAAGDSNKGHPPEHFDGADRATTENGKHPRRKYNNVALEASERGQFSAGAASGEDGHGATEKSVVRIRAEEEDEKPQRPRPAQETDGGETEESPPPKQSRALNVSGRQGGEGDPPPSSARPRRATRAQII